MKPGGMSRKDMVEIVRPICDPHGIDVNTVTSLTVTPDEYLIEWFDTEDRTHRRLRAPIWATP